MPLTSPVCASGCPLEELWLKHKEDIHHYYIAQKLTLKSTMSAMRDRHGFYASPTQYTTKLKAWGYIKNNSSSLYPGIRSSLKRKAISLDEVESVTVSIGSNERLIPTKKLKRAFRRVNGSKRQVEQLDAPSPPGFQVQYRRRLGSSGFKFARHPFTMLIAELVDTLGLPKACFSEVHAAQESRKGLLDRFQNPSFHKKAKLFDSGTSARFTIQLPSLVSEACKSLSVTQSKGLKEIFQAMFLMSNNQLTTSEATKFGEWLALNFEAGTLCRLRSWTAIALLTHLLHGAVEMDAVAVLRDAHLVGAKLESPRSLGSRETLLQHSLSHGSVKCARYLIDAGADVSIVHSIRQLRNSAEPTIHEKLCDAPLGIASRSYRCVDLIPALLARGACPNGMLLLEDSVRSGAAPETIKSLIDAGVSPNERGGLATAASLGRCDIMELLISAGACVEGGPPLDVFQWFESEEHLRSPAIAAATSKSVKALKLLVHHNVDLNASLLDNVSDHKRAKRLTAREEIFHPIQAAVYANDCDLVEYLIEKGASVTPKYGTPLLVLAAQRATTAMMALLLAHGANVNSISESSRSNFSALEAAAMRGRLSGMQFLIEAGSHVDMCGSRSGSRTPLQRAAEFGEWEAVKMLLESGADINAPHCPINGVSTLEALIQCQKLDWIVKALAGNASINPSPGTIGSPLIAAVATRNSDIVALLIRLGANVSQPAIPPKYTCGDLLLPLQLAAQIGHLEICKILIRGGAEVDGVVTDEDQDKKTPLAHACEAGEESVARYLISKKACLLGNSSSYSDTPFYLAVCHRHIDIVRLLLRHGLDPNVFCSGFETYDCQSGRSKQSTPLIEACRGPDGMICDEKNQEPARNLAELLVKYGANVNHRPSLSFNTPLQTACMKHNWKLVKLLLSQGADVNAPCSIGVYHHELWFFLGYEPTGINAFQAVIFTENMEMVELFLSRGADVHIPAGSTGRITALQAAALTGNVPIAEKLLKAGAQVDEPPGEVEGRTAIQAAAELGRLEMLSLLLCAYNGTRPIADICDDAADFAHKEGHDHVVGFLREYKGQHSQPLVAERQTNCELDDWVDWDYAS